MQFPIETSITPVTYGKLEGNVLRIDGNAGAIPPSFQFAVLQKTVTTVPVPAADEDSEPTTREDTTYALCYQGVSAMTSEQWEAWQEQEDNHYISSCIATNEGLTIA